LFIPVYGILIKYELIFKPTRTVLRTKSKSMFDDFGTCSKNLAMKSGSPTQYLGVSDYRTSVSVER